MRALIMLALLSACNTCPEGSRWSPAPEREDLRACNAARAGNSDGGWRFYACMKSLGYAEVCK